MINMQYRYYAMQWWNSLGDTNKTMLTIKFIGKRFWKFLTGREIEYIYIKLYINPKHTDQLIESMLSHLTEEYKKRNENNDSI